MNRGDVLGEGCETMEISRRDFVVQPRVARNELPWVERANGIKPQRGFINLATGHDATPLG